MRRLEKKYSKSDVDAQGRGAKVALAWRRARPDTGLDLKNGGRIVEGSFDKPPTSAIRVLRRFLNEEAIRVMG